MYHVALTFRAQLFAAFCETWSPSSHISTQNLGIAFTIEFLFENSLFILGVPFYVCYSSAGGGYLVFQVIVPVSLGWEKVMRESRANSRWRSYLDRFWQLCDIFNALQESTFHTWTAPYRRTIFLRFTSQENIKLRDLNGSSCSDDGRGSCFKKISNSNVK